MGSDKNWELIYIYLPGSAGPLARGERYEDPLQEALRQARLGEITGGGSSLGPKKSDGSRDIEFCGIESMLTMSPRLGRCCEIGFQRWVAQSAHSFISAPKAPLCRMSSMARAGCSIGHARCCIPISGSRMAFAELDR